MKNKPSELDVDFIGGEGPLTKDEEKTISDFIRKQKILKNKNKFAKPGLFLGGRLLLDKYNNVEIVHSP